MMSFVGLLFFVPLVVFGSNHADGIVPCTGTAEDPCTWTSLYTLAGRILTFIVILSTSVAAGVFAWAGVLYFSAGGDTGKIQKAHTLFAAVAIGLVIILTAFLVVDTLLKVLTDKGLDQRAAERGLKKK